MDTVAQRRAAFFKVVQFVILGVIVGVAPPVGIPIAIVWALIYGTKRAGRRAKLSELKAKHYTTRTRLFHSAYRPAVDAQQGDVWVDGHGTMYVHSGIEFEEV
jgi:hypothetical protein